MFKQHKLFKDSTRDIPLTSEEYYECENKGIKEAYIQHFKTMHLRRIRAEPRKYLIQRHEEDFFEFTEDELTQSHAYIALTINPPCDSEALDYDKIKRAIENWSWIETVYLVQEETKNTSRHPHFHLCIKKASHRFHSEVLAQFQNKFKMYNEHSMYIRSVFDFDGWIDYLVKMGIIVKGEIKYQIFHAVPKISQKKKKNYDKLY